MEKRTHKIISLRRQQDNKITRGWSLMWNQWLCKAHSEENKLKCCTLLGEVLSHIISLETIAKNGYEWILFIYWLWKSSKWHSIHLPRKQTPTVFIRNYNPSYLIVLLMLLIDVVVILQSADGFVGLSRFFIVRLIVNNDWLNSQLCADNPHGVVESHPA